MSFSPGPQIQPLLGSRGKRLRWDQNLLKLCPPWTAPGLRDPEGIALLPRGPRRRFRRGWDLEEGTGPVSQDRYDQEGWRYPLPGLDQGDVLSSQS